MKNKLAFRGGGYSLIITAIVVAIVVVVNVFASVLPSSMTNIDISSSQLYSVTSSTKSIVNNLEQDVTIYWIVQTDEEDEILENLLSKYESLSDYITVEKINPDVYPTFTETYTDEDVANNSLIVESGDVSRYIAYEDIYEYEIDYYSYSYYTDAFDGEGQITSAINYVTSDELPKIYILEGHGEGDLPEDVTDQITKENIETETLSLLTVEAVPEDADAVLIYAPTSDLSEDEVTLLSDYISEGGNLLVISGPQEEDELTNLNALLNNYGVTVNEGIVIEEDTDYYVYGYPYLLLPEINSSDITDPLIEESYYVLMPISSGLTISDDNGSGTVTSLLDSSDTSFSKIAGYSLETYEKEDGDIDGSFSLAVYIEDTSGGTLTWFASSLFLEDTYNSYSSGANLNVFINALSNAVGETESVSISSKSLNYSYLTISESTSSMLKILMIAVIPLAYLAVGIIVVVRKRRNQTEVSE